MKLTKMMATLFLLIPLTSFSQELGQRISQDDSVTNGAIVIHTQRLKSDPGGNLLS